MDVTGEFSSSCSDHQHMQNLKSPFYMTHPHDQKMFIQCDEFGKAFARKCPFETVFTDNLACEDMHNLLPIDSFVSFVSQQHSGGAYGSAAAPAPEASSAPAYQAPETTTQASYSAPAPAPEAPSAPAYQAPETTTQAPETTTQAAYSAPAPAPEAPAYHAPETTQAPETTTQASYSAPAPAPEAPAYHAPETTTQASYSAPAPAAAPSYHAPSASYSSSYSNKQAMVQASSFDDVSNSERSKLMQVRSH